MKKEQAKKIIENFARKEVRKILNEDNGTFIDDNFINISQFKNRFRIISRLTKEMDERMDRDISYEEFRNYISKVESSISYISNSVNDRYRNS